MRDTAAAAAVSDSARAGETPLAVTPPEDGGKLDRSHRAADRVNRSCRLLHPDGPGLDTPMA